MPRLSTCPYFHHGAIHKDCRFGRYVEIGARSRLNEVIMGDYAYCDAHADIAYADIGKFANIASHVRINPGQHPMEKASLHHFTYRSSYYFPEEEDDQDIFAWRRNMYCRIGADSWIGYQAVIKAGCNVGIGAVVGASAVVTKDIPDYAIAVGNPAQVIRMRFPKETALRLKALAWWDWSHEALRQALPDFRTLAVEDFLERYESFNH